MTQQYVTQTLAGEKGYDKNSVTLVKQNKTFQYLLYFHDHFKIKRLE